MNTLKLIKDFPAPLKNLFRLQLPPYALDIKYMSEFLGYQNHCYVEIESKKYTLKTATNLSEIYQALKLRNKCFFELEQGIDKDSFDALCDHLIIIDNETQGVVGTYRVISDSFNMPFYSEGEFNLDQVKKLRGVKMELGRACISVEHRNGAVIDLLWKGIGKYAKELKADWLFGCSSVKTTSAVSMSKLNSYLKSKDLILNDIKISVNEPFIHPALKSGDLEVSDSDIAEGKEYLPNLVKSYLMAGAKVSPVAAYDEEFKCFDLLTLLKIDEMSSSYKRRYMA
ncbi:MAG: GNAT family N-acetyltransferase [Oligoflexia bacterium]|nr:GNAT family N-acetyltransferase [Oligoflexia bacterium]